MIKRRSNKDLALDAEAARYQTAQAKLLAPLVAAHRAAGGRKTITDLRKNGPAATCHPAALAAWRLA